MCVCVPVPLLLQCSSNELTSLGTYLKQVTAVINSRHVMHQPVAEIVTAMMIVQTLFVLVVNVVVCVA